MEREHKSVYLLCVSVGWVCKSKGRHPNTTTALNRALPKVGGCRPFVLQGLCACVSVCACVLGRSEGEPLLVHKTSCDDEGHGHSRWAAPLMQEHH